jgi:3-hydroxybutyrate dehydrogenase
MTNTIQAETTEPSSSEPLKGQVAVVTGAGRGLGHAIMDELQRAGATVVGVDLAGSDVSVDVGTRAGNIEMVEYALQKYGRLDAIVLNAGVQHVAPFGTFPESEWDRLMNVNLKGPFLGLQAAWDALAASSLGRAVVVSSTTAVAADPNKAAYVSSKAGVLGLVRSAAVDGAPLGISVNAVLPGWMRTEIAERQLQAKIDQGKTEEEAIEEMFARQPVKRFVETSEVAAVVRFLLSPESSAITGVSLPVDLGLLTQ